MVLVLFIYQIQNYKIKLKLAKQPIFAPIYIRFEKELETL